MFIYILFEREDIDSVVYCAILGNRLAIKDLLAPVS